MTLARQLGLVPLVEATELLDVDRRVLDRLYKTGALAGERGPRNEIWLSRTDLSAYAWSRPRCVVSGCGRRVLGAGPGCTRHPHHGKRHTAETRQKLATKARGRSPGTLVVQTACNRDGCTRWSAGRFCSHKCLRDWLHSGPGSPDRLEQLRRGRSAWRAKVAAAKVGGMLTMSDLGAALPLELRRSQAAVSGHLTAGAIAPIKELKIALFPRDQIEPYAAWLRNHPDGRLARFNATTPERIKFRGRWYEARFKSTAMHGTLAQLTAPRSLESRQREQRLIELWTEGIPVEQIAQELGVVPNTIKKMRAALNLPKRRPGRPRKR